MMDNLLRWPGGKKWLARRIAPILEPLIKGTYIEPFLGSGAMFFQIQPQSSILNDRNEDLIGTLRTLRRYPLEVLRQLKNIPCNEDEYYKQRSITPSNNMERAVRFLYLNRTCYRGVYRLNRSGIFNVPYGDRTTNTLTRGDVIIKSSKALKSSKLISGDFSAALQLAHKGDFVYCDPVYISKATPSTFSRYGWGEGDWDMQIRLRNHCENAAQRGALVIVSNLYEPEILKLYKGIPNLHYTRQSNLSGCNGESRKVGESLFLFGISHGIRRQIKSSLNF